MNIEPLQKIFRSSRDFLADLLFPIECLGCGKSGEYLCTGCQVSLPRIVEERCPGCHRTSTRGATCLDCVGQIPLAGIYAALDYRHPLTTRVIHTYKYRFVESLAAPLADILITRIHNDELPLPTLILPVPLHTTRLRWRNFNQAELIARHLATTLTPGLPLPLSTEHLIRTRATLPQAKTKNKKERLENLSGAFAVSGDLTGASVWLVDDVATTNATLIECARVLRSAGAKSVYGVVVAR